jgi:flagellar motor switch protein FliN
VRERSEAMSDKDKSGSQESYRERKLGNYAHLGDINLKVTVEFGRREMAVEDARRLKVDDVIELDKLAGEAFEIKANDHVFAEGEIVVVTDLMACRVTRLVD